MLALCKRLRLSMVALRRTLLIMKLTATLILLLCLHAYARTYSQEITLSLNNAKLETVFKEIQKQTDYKFVYTKEQLEGSAKITIKVKDESLEQVLNLCFKDQPLTYTIAERHVIIRIREKLVENRNEPAKLLDVSGRIVNEKGETLPGTSIRVKGTKNGAFANESGEFFIKGVAPNATLIVTSVGYEPMEMELQGRTYIIIQLRLLVSNLDETVVIAYGTTTRRLNTGSVSKVSSADINKQPVSNPLAALSGRVPGMTVTQTNGIPGSAFKVQIRGQNSINAGNDPLFIIDGVPFAANNSSINQVGSALGSGGLSPFSMLSPDDIESIEILKDADATAIYGSRGANGVVLITTKKAKAGKTKTEVNFWTGGSKVTRTMEMLKTDDYIALRKEAFRNDNRTITASSARDLKVWDSTRYTDFRKLLIGGTAKVSHLQLTVSGGNEATQFMIGGRYHFESTVFPGDLSDKKVSFFFNVTHSDKTQRLNVSLTGSLLNDRNRINVSDLTNYVSLPPNTPELYDSTGNLNWQKDGFSFTNPLAYLRQEYLAKTDNLLQNLKMSYRIKKDFNVRLNLGYNSISVADHSLYPLSSQNPALNPKGYNNFGNSSFKSLIAEPQADYEHRLGKGQITYLAGLTWQRNETDAYSISGYGYDNDALLKSISAAPQISGKTNSFREYRYAAAFARVRFTQEDKYILSLNGRRDGSSRFGPGKQYSNFGSLAGAWLFNKEKFIEKNLKFISYGKLRMSYGITGNDQIGDYQYLNTWNSTTQGIPGIFPTGLFNPDFRWEKNKKFESAAEISMFKDRFFISIAYYNNRSTNQLVNYSLPSQTGSSSIISNFPAKIENKGFEIESVNRIINRKNFKWTSSLHVTFPKNRLLSFPGIESSSYSGLVVGQSLNLYAGFYVSGVDPNTGVYMFLDKNGQPTATPSEEDRRINLGNLDPRYYGGFQNNFKFFGIELDIYFEFRKQTGRNYLSDLVFYIPGTMNNQPSIILERWSKPGDITSIQKLTTRAGNPAFTAALLMRNSGAQILYGDASYARLKNVSLSYNIPASIATKLKLNTARIYCQAQNLLTITNYKGSDPETQNLYRLPPLKTFTAGIQFTF